MSWRCFNCGDVIRDFLIYTSCHCNLCDECFSKQTKKKSKQCINCGEKVNKKQKALRIPLKKPNIKNSNSDSSEDESDSSSDNNSQDENQAINIGQKRANSKLKDET